MRVAFWVYDMGLWREKKVVGEREDRGVAISKKMYAEEVAIIIRLEYF